jgi:membrane protein implicated in regulation of membrane protease activity
MTSFHRIVFLLLGSLFSLAFIACGVLLLFVLEGWQKLGFLPQVGLGIIFLRYFIRKYGNSSQEKARENEPTNN